MAERKITKVLYDSDKDVMHIEYGEIKDGRFSEYKVKFYEIPAPEFFQALAYLSTAGIKLLALKLDDFKSRILSNGAEFSRNANGFLFASLLLELEVDNENFHAAIPIKTPKLSEELFSPEMEEAVNRIMHEAQRYLDGNRAQTSLFSHDDQSQVKPNLPDPESPELIEHNAKMMAAGISAQVISFPQQQESAQH